MLKHLHRNIDECSGRIFAQISVIIEEEQTRFSGEICADLVARILDAVIVGRYIEGTVLLQMAIIGHSGIAFLQTVDLLLDTHAVGRDGPDCFAVERNQLPVLVNLDQIIHNIRLDKVVSKL